MTQTKNDMKFVFFSIFFLIRILLYFRLGRDDSTPYQNQLKLMQELLSNNTTTDEEVEDQLGTSIAALYSVPTAIYCFLRAQSEIPGVEVKILYSFKIPI